MTTEVKININFQQPGQVELMTVAMGLGTPKVLIELDESSDEEVYVYNIESATPIENPDELILFLDIALISLKAAWAKRPEGTDEDVAALRLPTVDDIAGEQITGSGHKVDGRES